MIKNNKISIIVITFLTVIMLFIPTYSYATSIGSPIDDPGAYRPGTIDPGDTTQIVSKANTILSAISTIGIVVSVITLMILGIKYMVGSVSEKAEYKKSMIPYIIGIVFLTATSTIVKIILNLTQEVIQ